MLPGGPLRDRRHAAVFLESLAEQEQIGDPGDPEAVDVRAVRRDLRGHLDDVFVIASMSAPAKTNTTAVMTDLEISNATVAETGTRCTSRSISLK
jgi:hypothetical protein